jgi:hypothetical protein
MVITASAPATASAAEVAVPQPAALARANADGTGFEGHDRLARFGEVDGHAQAHCPHAKKRYVSHDYLPSSFAGRFSVAPVI